MPHYVVTWKMDFEADTPREAAEMALAVHRKDDSIANVFSVLERGSKHAVLVDLDEETEG